VGNNKGLQEMIVGISGGTGSGKTTLAHKIINELEKRLKY